MKGFGKKKLGIDAEVEAEIEAEKKSLLKRAVKGLVILMLVVGVVLVGTAVMMRLRGFSGGVSYEKMRVKFPEFENLEISENRKRVLRVAKKEFEEFEEKTANEKIKIYVNGEKWEPWCADFVSWIYKEAGQEFKNPNSGGWRIPGIWTLREYFERESRWREPNTYQPQVGDVVIYNNGVFGGHTNIVVFSNGNKIKTVGGNENNQVLLQSFEWTDKKYGVVGFGVNE